MNFGNVLQAKDNCQPSEISSSKSPPLTFNAEAIRLCIKFGSFIVICSNDGLLDFFDIFGVTLSQNLPWLTVAKDHSSSQYSGNQGLISLEVIKNAMH